MLFQGKHYWKTIRFQLQTGYPRLISDGFRGLDEQRFFTGHLDAAFVYSGDNHTYFIKDAMVWRLNSFKEFTSSIDNDYPQFVARWLHIGEKITGALRWTNGRNYFFSHRSYYRFDHVHHRVRKTKIVDSIDCLSLFRSMIPIQHTLVQYPNGGFNVIPKALHPHRINLVSIVGNDVQQLSTNRLMITHHIIKHTN